MKRATIRKMLVTCISAIIVFAFSCKKKEEVAVQEPEPQQEEITMEEKMNRSFEEFLSFYIAEVKKLDKEESLAAWQAYTEGKDEHYKAMEEAAIKKKTYHSDSEKYKQLKEIKKSGAIVDPLLKRQLDIIHNDFLANQLPPDLMEKMVKLSTEIEKTFNTARGVVDDKEYSRNDVVEVLKNSKDNKLRRKVWEAHKEVGVKVADKLVELIKLRNEAAKQLGFENYREMQLILQDYDPEALNSIFKELAEKTQEPFTTYKAELDEKLAKNLKIKKTDDLRPWHYADPFFQDAPQFTKIDFDKYFQDKDLVEIAASYFKSFGLDIAPVLDRSDLFPKKGKSEHAFCFTIDRDEPDVRVLCNIVPNASWMDTLLHELGHGLYDSYYTEDMPWRLREPAHIFTTEGIAQLFGEMSKNPYWLKEMIGLSDKEVKKIKEQVLKQKALGRLIFARWSLVMYHFEKSLYEDPDQDLTALWWGLVEKYQQVKRPEGREKPDWATKDHIVAAPVYYHNYVLGQMFQDQLQEKAAGLAGETDPLKVIFKDKPELGTFLIDNVFKPGATRPWPEFVEASTGKPLGVDSYIGSLTWGMEE
ncbi:MAG: M2 family metallopeptidase [Pseudomonadota bacterium]